MQPRQPQICKFGQNCNRFAQGTCKFVHANQEGSQGNNNKMMHGNKLAPQNFQDSRGPRGPRNPNYPPNNFQNNNPRNFNEGTGNNMGGGNMGGGNMGWGTQHGNWGKFNQPGNNPNMAPKGDEFTSKFCMSYQFNQPCRYEQKGKCSRIHGFDEQQKIRRVAFSNQIPPEEPSKLGKFVSGGQTFFILRMGSAITILLFNQETGQFAPQKTWKFPKPQLSYSFYSQKQNFIYFAAENPKTSLHDIGIYDMLNDVLITIEQAHQSHVTQVLHFSTNILLSSSKDGTIKVWNVSGTTVSLDVASTQGLFTTYSSGKNTQILFLDLSIVNGMKVLSAGTNDNRILFFLGDQMKYTPLVLSQKHTQAFKIRYCTINEVTVAFVITWTQDNSSSSVIAVNLNDFSVSDVVTHSTKQHPRNNIYLIEVIQEKLFVATLQGTVTIYSLPLITKMGLMLHKNPVNSIVAAEYVTKTNIKIPQMFVLQSKYNQKPGSIGVYTVKL